MKYMVDIDGTICNNTYGKYETAEPILNRIEYFNQLYDQGHEIHYWTARGGNSGLDWTELTLKQLTDWGVRYTTARTGKPAYDLFICDKAVNADVYFEEIK
jgi:hypothetical protein